MKEITTVEQLEAESARIDAAAREALAAGDEEMLQEASSMRGDALKAAAGAAMVKSIAPLLCVLGVIFNLEMAHAVVFMWGWEAAWRAALIFAAVAALAAALGIVPTKRLLPWAKFFAFQGDDVKAARFALNEKRGLDMSRKARVLRSLALYAVGFAVMLAGAGVLMLLLDAFGPFLMGFDAFGAGA